MVDYQSTKPSQKKIKYLGTCGVCFRVQKVQNGGMAHHGFKRPGWGQIYGDCPGSGLNAFEVSPKATEFMLQKDIDTVKRLQDQINNIDADIPDKYPYRTYNRIGWTHDGRGEYEVISIPRGAKSSGIPNSLTYVPSFEEAKQEYRQGLEKQKKMYNESIAFYEGKLKDWQPKPLVEVDK